MLNRRRVVDSGVAGGGFSRRRRTNRGSPEPGVARWGPTQKINHSPEPIDSNAGDHFDLPGGTFLIFRRPLGQQSDELLDALKPRSSFFRQCTLFGFLGEAGTVISSSVIHH